MAAPAHQENELKEALGAAVIALWAELPELVQQKLFEHAVVAGHHSERYESLRQELARFLHEAWTAIGRKVVLSFGGAPNAILPKHTSRPVRKAETLPDTAISSKSTPPHDSITIFVSS